MENTDIQEIQEIQEIQNINPRSRTGRRRIIGKTTPDGKPEDPDYFKKYYELNIKQPLQCGVCGSLITKYAMRKHKETKYCIQMGVFEIAHSLL